MSSNAGISKLVSLSDILALNIYPLHITTACWLTTVAPLISPAVAIQGHRKLSTSNVKRLAHWGTILRTFTVQAVETKFTKSPFRESSSRWPYISAGASCSLFATASHLRPPSMFVSELPHGYRLRSNVLLGSAGLQEPCE